MQTRHIVKAPLRRDLAFKTVQDMRDFARANAPAALKTLIEIHQDDKAKSAARVSAAREILDRGFGKPAQQILLEQPDDKKIIDLVSDAEYSVSKVMDLPLVTGDEDESGGEDPEA